VTRAEPNRARQRTEWLRKRRAADAVLPRYDLAGARLTLIGHAVNAVFRVDAPLALPAPVGSSPASPASSTGARRRFVLRVYQPASGGYVANHDTPSILSELAWVRSLRHDAGLVVLDPIPAYDGALLTEVEGDSLDPWRCVLSAWVPGRRYSTGLTPARLERVGRFMGRMHAHAAAFVPPAGFTRPRWDWERLFGAASVLDPARGGLVFDAAERDVFAALARHADGVMRALGEGPRVFGLIHSDLHQGNYLFQGGDVHAIDFDECGFGHYLFDIAVTLFALRRREDYASLRAAFLQGYCREHALTKRDEGYLETFLALRVVDFVNWIMSWTSPDDRSWGRAYLAHAGVMVRAFLNGEPWGEA